MVRDEGFWAKVRTTQMQTTTYHAHALLAATLSSEHMQVLGNHSIWRKAMEAKGKCNFVPNRDFLPITVTCVEENWLIQ